VRQQVTCSQFRSEHPQFLGAHLRNIVTTATWARAFVRAPLLQTFGRIFWAGYQARRKACIYKDNIGTEMDQTNVDFCSRIRNHGTNSERLEAAEALNNVAAQ